MPESLAALLFVAFHAHMSHVTEISAPVSPGLAGSSSEVQDFAKTLKLVTLAWIGLPQSIGYWKLRLINNAPRNY